MSEEALISIEVDTPKMANEVFQTLIKLRHDLNHRLELVNTAIKDLESVFGLSSVQPCKTIKKHKPAGFYDKFFKTAQYPIVDLNYRDAMRIYASANVRGIKLSMNKQSDETYHLNKVEELCHA